MIIILLLIAQLITTSRPANTQNTASSVEQNLSETSSFKTDTNGLEMDTLMFEIVESSPDSNNIIHYKLNSINTRSNHTIASIDLYQANPFVNSANSIIPNNHPAAYFFIKSPGDGHKVSMKNILPPEILTQISDDDRFEKAICGIHFNELSESHIAIGYTLDFHMNYNEYFGNGFAVSYVKVFDLNAKLIYQKQVSGALISNPLISTDGSCLVYLYAVTPYWSEETKHILTVIRIRDNETVYYEEFGDITSEESTLWLEGDGNTIGVMVNKFPPSRLLFIDASNKLIYRIKNDLLQQYHVHRLNSDCYQLNISDGTKKICFDEDFNKIKF